jgi:homoserine kinase
MCIRWVRKVQIIVERHCKWPNISHRLEWENSAKMIIRESGYKNETVSGSGPTVFIFVSGVETSTPVTR